MTSQASKEFALSFEKIRNEDNVLTRFEKALENNEKTPLALIDLLSRTFKDIKQTVDSQNNAIDRDQDN